jgi:hypothetical protein
LYGCRTCFLALREEQRLVVFENRALGGTFEAKGEEGTGGLREMRSEYYSSSNNMTLK